MKRISVALACALALLAWSPLATRAPAQGQFDPSLAEEIFRIRAIDHHAHPMRAPREGEEDREFDALIPDVLEPAPLPVRLRPDNAEFIGAWRDFWGYAHDDMAEAHLREVDEARRRAAREQGDNYPAWVLDHLNIEVMFANRVAMGRGLTPQRFRWVAFDDALILPLSSAAVRKINPDYAAFYPGEDALLRRYLSDLKMTAVPATLREFTARVVTPTLEAQRRAGAVAVKFEAAYLRGLDFADASETEAARVYTRYARGGAPTAAEYKPLQDFLFRYVAREAGRLGLALHLHRGGGLRGHCGAPRRQAKRLRRPVQPDLPPLPARPRRAHPRLARIRPGEGHVRHRRLRAHARTRLGRGGLALEPDGARGPRHRPHRHDARRRDHARPRLRTRTHGHARPRRPALRN